MNINKLVAIVLPLLFWCPQVGAEDGAVLRYFNGSKIVSSDTVPVGDRLIFSSLGVKVSSSSTMTSYDSFTNIQLFPNRSAIQQVVDPGNTSDLPLVSPEITIPRSYDPVKVIGDAEPDTPTPTTYDISGATIKFVGTLQYIGSPITPTFTVSCNGVSLSAETDYDISNIENNINAGEGTLTLKGKGNYTGSITDYFTIHPVSLTVEADSKTKTYGDENPELTYQITGYVTGEDSTDLTKQPVIQTTATKNSPIGEYEIIVSGGEARNYEFSYVPGKLTVTKKDMSNAILSFPDSCVYSGKAIQPVPSVTLDSIELVADKDFKLSYANNVEPSDSARMTVTGFGNYTGKIDMTFVIYMKPTVSVMINDSLIVPVVDELVNYSAPAIFESEQGTIYVTNYYAAAGKTVGLTVTPKPYYYIAKDSISVLGKDSVNLIGDDPEKLNSVRDYRYIVPEEGEVIIKAVFSVDSLTTEVYINGKLLKGDPDSLESKKLTFQHEWGTAVVDNAFALIGDSAVVTVTAIDTTLINSVIINDSIMFPQSDVEAILSKSNQFKYPIPENGKASIRIQFVIDEKAVGIRDLSSGEQSFTIHNVLGRKVDSGFVYGRQDALDRVKRLPQGLYIIKLNNKSFKVYKK